MFGSLMNRGGDCKAYPSVAGVGAYFLDKAGMKKMIANWNNYPAVEEREISFDHDKEIIAKLTRTAIPHGNGRCYGDASLSGEVVNTLRYDKILAFDEVNGVIRCQSGLLLADLLKVIVPRGWFLPVTPGTKFITVGGAV